MVDHDLVSPRRAGLELDRRYDSQLLETLGSMSFFHFLCFGGLAIKTWLAFMHRRAAGCEGCKSAIES